MQKKQQKGIMMSFIKSFFQAFNPQIKTSHIKFEEECANRKIARDFVCFNAENVEISNIFAAKILAKRMGQKVFPFLDKLIKNASNTDKKNNILKTKAWVDKKAVWHPAMVENSTYEVLKKMKNGKIVKSLGLPYKQIRTDAAIAAILHDIGRLSEVDIAQGDVVQKHKGMNKSHAAISFDILEHAKIKPEILLAVRYHEFAGMKEAVEDKIYRSLPEKSKKLAEFYIKLLQDMDKTGNLVERSVCGAKKSAEYFNPEFAKDYSITDECFKIAMSGEYLPVRKGHLLDVMVHYITWGYAVHYKATADILTSILSNIFLRIYEEAWDEYNNSEHKNPIKLANTLEKLIALENYAIFERTGLQINEKNREKTVREIQNLRNEKQKIKAIN